MKRLLVAIGFLLTIASIFYFSLSVSTHWQSIRNTNFELGDAPVYVCAALLYMFTYGISSKAWQLVLRCLNAELSLLSAFRILAVSQFAKYLPGNVGHHVGRLLLAKQSGVPSEATVVSMVMDSAMVVAAALVCSLPAVAVVAQILGRVDINLIQALLTAVSIVTVLVLFFMVLPISRNYAFNAARRYKSLLEPHRIKFLLGAVALHSANFILGGLALLAIAYANEPTNSTLLSMLLPVIGIYAAAWLIGFLLPGAPAGLGIREACLLLGLSPLLGEPTALLTAAILRLVTTLSDGIVFIAGLRLHKARSSHLPS